MPRDHISFSEWTLWRKECQWRWKLDYLDGLRGKNFGINLDFGSAMHEALENYKRKKDSVVLDVAVDIFRRKFQSFFDSNNDKYDERDRLQGSATLLVAGENILRRLNECDELSSAEVIYNEHELLLPIARSDDVKINFKGFIDIVIKSKDGRGKPVLYVADFKTCSWGWNREKKEDVNLHFQILLYKHFLCKKFNIDPKQVRTAFILLKKKPALNSPAIEFFPISAGPVSVQRALDELNSDITQMIDCEKLGPDVYVRNRKACVNQYGQKCPYLGTDNCKDK